MSQPHLDRRRMVSGGLALVSACMVPGKAGAVSPIEGTAAGPPRMEPEVLSDSEIFGWSAEEAAAYHAPFRTAFLAWHDEASGRLTLPFSVDTSKPSCTDLHVAGLHPALNIRLDGGSGIDVYVNWRDVCWDILVSLDVHATPAPDGSGWLDGLLMPEAQHIHPTREACWRQDGFECLLHWLNDDLAIATHLVLWGGDNCYQGDDWTAAHLLRDGLLLRSGKPIAESNAIRELLPLHGWGM